MKLLKTAAAAAVVVFAAQGAQAGAMEFYQLGFEPLVEGFLHVPYNDAAAVERRRSQ